MDARFMAGAHGRNAGQNGDGLTQISSHLMMIPHHDRGDRHGFDLDLTKVTDRT